MNLYLISQEDNNGYDTYDSAVVCAPDEATAKLIHPAKGLVTEKEFPTAWYYGWCNSPEQVTVKHIGLATTDMEIGVVCASFNAG